MLTLEQWLMLAAIAAIPILAGSVITGGVLRLESAKRHREQRKLQALLDAPDAD